MNASRKIFLFLAAALLPFAAAAQADRRGLARVQKINGVEAYFLSEPLRAYEMTFDKSSGIMAGSYLSGGVVNESISDKAAQFISRALKEAEKENKQLDAIVYSAGKKIAAVKFSEAATDASRGIGRVKKINGLDVYVLSEPLLDYQNVVQRSGGAKMKSFITGGVVNNSIEDDVEQFVRRLQKEAEADGKTIDAVVYSGGKNAIGIKYKATEAPSAGSRVGGSN